MEGKIIKNGKAILRHSALELAEHWILAISGFLLIFSGFGELPMYKRFMITRIPGMAWAGDFFINLKIHYLAGIVFVSVMVFHAVYHGWSGHAGLIPKRGDVKASLITILSMFGIGEEPKSHKYLPEQRLAYAYLGLTGLILVTTGIVKVIKNLPDVYFSPAFIRGMTLIHTFATIFFLLGVFAHLAALIFKVNRPLVRSIFTREVDLGYVRKRHTVWYEELMKNKGKAKQIPPEMKDASAEKDKEMRFNESTERKENIIMASVLKVKGMSCQHCVMSVTKALNRLDGIQNVNVDLQKGEVQFDNTKALALDQVEKAIEDAGYQVAKG